MQIFGTNTHKQIQSHTQMYIEILATISRQRVEGKERGKGLFDCKRCQLSISTLAGIANLLATQQAKGESVRISRTFVHSMLQIFSKVP